MAAADSICISVDHLMHAFSPFNNLLSVVLQKIVKLKMDMLVILLK